MKKKHTILFLALIFALNTFSQDKILEKRITVHQNGASIRQIIEKINQENSINFSFRSNIKELKKQKKIHAENETLKEVLKKLFSDTQISYIVYGKQIILIEKKKKEQRLRIKGIIISSNSASPLSYATIANINTGTGVVADLQGRFELNVLKKKLTDSLRISCLGYKPTQICIKDISGVENAQIILQPTENQIEEVSISSSFFYTKKEGNKGFIPVGSLYIDTHGQQTALLITPQKNSQGRLIKIGFRLSGKGNVNAPFRVRIYSVDSITGKPAQDLLPYMVIVRPKKQKGWFYVDVSQYEIQLPKNGFFAGMEGIYPNDFSGGNSGFIDLSNSGYQDPVLSLSYGQRLSYNKKGQNKTWHYSLSHTWFQIEKRKFNVMISAVIDYRKQ